MLFLFLSLFAIALIYYATGKQMRLLLLWSSWAITISALSFNGYFQNTQTIPPPIALVILGLIGLTALTIRWSRGIQVNIRLLTSIHVLRFPIEITIHGWYLNQLVPREMTYEGWNFDIVSGLTALLILIWWFFRNPPRQVMVAFNLMGLALLAIIVTTATLAVPTPFQLIGLDQPNLAILKFPNTLLPGILVPAVLTAHLLGLKKLLRHKDV